MKKFFLFFLFFLALPLYSAGEIYNLTFSDFPSFQKLTFEMKTGWGTRYTPPGWAKGYEVWSGFNYGISKRLSGEVYAGYNFSTQKYGVMTGVGYDLGKLRNWKFLGKIALYRETTQFFTLHAGLITTYGKEFYEFSMSSFFDKTFAPHRDPIDWHLTGAVSRKFGILTLGFEYLGEDLEDLWEEEEAEGGANNFLGVLFSLHMKRFGISITPGYSLGPRPRDRNSFLVLGKIWFVI